MIPKLHKKGKSFRSAATYLLHDKGAATCKRVAWTKTKNLATNRPEAAWRVMAATAMDQTRLKSKAGVKSTGRKSKNVVLHLTLSWHPDEASSLTRYEMLRAAEGALEALGASDFQALLVSHKDEPHPHVHVLVNRVSPTDGRMLSSSKEKLVLSKWAQSYERERGKILCGARVENNARRDQGLFTRGANELPRSMVDVSAGPSHSLREADVQNEQLALDLVLGQKERDLQKRHERERSALESERQKDVDLLERSLGERIDIAAQRARARFSGEWKVIEEKHERERLELHGRENSLMGKSINILQLVDWSGLLRRERRGKTVQVAFALLTGHRSKRSEELRRAQSRETAQIERMESLAVRVAIDAERDIHSAALQNRRTKFLLDRECVLQRQKLELARMKDLWRVRIRERKSALETARSPLLASVRTIIRVGERARSGNTTER